MMPPQACDWQGTWSGSPPHPGRSRHLVLGLQADVLAEGVE